MAFVCLAIVLSTAGIYLRSWELEFRIQELKVGGDCLLAQAGGLDGWIFGRLGWVQNGICR